MYLITNRGGRAKWPEIIPVEPEPDHTGVGSISIPLRNMIPDEEA